MRVLLALILVVSCVFSGSSQGLKIELITCKEIGSEGSATLFEVGFKVITGKIVGTGQYTPLALVLPNGTKAFAYLNDYDEVLPGKTAPSPTLLKVYGAKVERGNALVSHDLATIKTPTNRTFEFESRMAFLSDEPKVFFGGIKAIKGFAKVGDEISYVNARGESGKGKIMELQVEGGYQTEVIFEGIPDDIVNIKVLSFENIDFSESKVMPAKSGSSVVSSPSVKPPKTMHKIKTIPVESILENKEARITIHNLIKFNLDSTHKSMEVFKLDYSLDYYIIDATFENKTTKPLDLGEYLLRFNFFNSEGKSADDFLRVFRDGNKSNDQVKKDADKIDTNIFGGTSKIKLAAVMVKYEETIADYDSKYRAQTNALNTPLKSGQKIRSINATIMGVPPEYMIEGLGTWNGTFLEKKNLLFVPIKIK